MKTLILFATKHGTAGEVAKRIAKNMNDADIHDLKELPLPSLSDYDCVVVGSSVYGGKIRKEAKAFLSKNPGMLCERNLGLYICGIAEQHEKEAFRTNFPSDILAAAKASYFLGGIYDPSQFPRMERFIMKLLAGHSEYIDSIDDDKIKEFTDILNG